jgi:hypothetical protein
MIGNYPDLTDLDLADRPLLDPLFRGLGDGVSELTFAGIYCFRGPHDYRITRLADGTFVLTGSDKGRCFFICPFSLPRQELLDELFARCTCLKLATTAQAEWLRGAGYRVSEDRDNFDYLYRREPLATLAGRALQKKRNLVHHFQREHASRSEPLVPERIPDALAVLEAWRAQTRDTADYAPAREALLCAQELGLQGRITYVADRPVGYAQGEPAGKSGMYLVHFEKTVPDMKGLYQFINQDFVRALPPEFTLINREQDLGDPGLRQSKLTYRPCAYVHKFRAHCY